MKTKTPKSTEANLKKSTVNVVYAVEQRENWVLGGSRYSTPEAAAKTCKELTDANPRHSFRVVEVQTVQTITVL